MLADIVMLQEFFVRFKGDPTLRDIADRQKEYLSLCGPWILCGRYAMYFPIMSCERIPILTENYLTVLLLTPSLTFGDLNRLLASSAFRLLDMLFCDG